MSVFGGKSDAAGTTMAFDPGLDGAMAAENHDRFLFAFRY
jgi:hypothetical protein